MCACVYMLHFRSTIDGRDEAMQCSESVCSGIAVDRLMRVRSGVLTAAQQVFTPCFGVEGGGRDRRPLYDQLSLAKQGR